MSEETLSIDDILAQCEGACQEAWDAAREDWKPPNGDYDTVIVGARLQPYVKEGKTVALIAVMHQIIGGPMADRQFEFGLFPNWSGFSAAKGLCSLLTPGTPAPSKFGEAAKLIINAAKGKNVRLTISQAPDKSTGKLYPPSVAYHCTF